MNGRVPPGRSPFGHPNSYLHPMLAVWLEDQQLSVRGDVPDVVPDQGEALVRVVAAGICNTDLELVRGYYPYRGILGHEFVGVVEVGPERLVGQRVVGEINAVCGRCVHCRAGRPTHCSDRSVLGIVNRHGAFAEYVALPVENLHVIPTEVSTDAAVFTEPLAAALEIQQQIAIRPTDRILVVGDGKLGQLICQTLALGSAQVLVAGRHASKLRLLDTYGIDAARGEDLEGAPFDIVVECTGRAEGFEQAVQAVRPRGTIVMKSTYAGALELDAAAVVVNELTLVGSRCGPFAPALRLLAAERVDVLPLIHARYPLGHALDAFEHAQRPDVLKVLLEME